MLAERFTTDGLLGVEIFMPAHRRERERERDRQRDIEAERQIGVTPKKPIDLLVAVCLVRGQQRQGERE